MTHVGGLVRAGAAMKTGEKMCESFSMAYDLAFDGSKFLFSLLGAFASWGSGGGIHYHPWPSSYEHRPSHPYNPGTEQLVGFHRLGTYCFAPSAKRREVLGGSHEE